MCTAASPIDVENIDIPVIHLLVENLMDDFDSHKSFHFIGSNYPDEIFLGTESEQFLDAAAQILGQLRRSLRRGSNSNGILVLCESDRLGLPLKIFTDCLNDSQKSPFVAFFPIVTSPYSVDHAVASSYIQTIFGDCDLDSAAHCLVNSSSYYSGISPWGCHFALVEESAFPKFLLRLQRALNGRTFKCDWRTQKWLDGHTTYASTLGSKCLLSTDGLPTSPRFFYDLSPDSPALSYSNQIAGFMSNLLTFRTAKEALILTKNIASRRFASVGWGDLSCVLNVWLSDASLAWQIGKALMPSENSNVKCVCVNASLVSVIASVYLRRYPHANFVPHLPDY
ncbi:unnamed protein product, partial [Protopolystoma xenopodis]